LVIMGWCIYAASVGANLKHMPDWLVWVFGAALAFDIYEGMRRRK